MAEKRMFSKKIIDTDWFMDMPQSAQNLYFHLSMRADDDGFVDSPQRICRMVGSSGDDYKLLIAKRFIIPFESGICVIKDWRINNYLRADRYTPTIHSEEKAQLEVEKNGEYSLGIPTVYPDHTLTYTNTNTNTSNNLEKKETNTSSNTTLVDKERKHFTKPTVEEISAYCAERKNDVDPQRFFDFYEAKGWKIGNNPMKDWKAAVRTWERRNADGSTKKTDDDIKSKYAGLNIGDIL